MHAVRTHRRRLSQVDTMARQLRQKNSASDLVAVTTGGIGHADGWLRRDVEMLTTSGRRNRLWHVKGCLGGGEQDEKARRCVGLCGAGDDQADDPQTKFTRHCNCMEIRSSAQIELSPAEDNQVPMMNQCPNENAALPAALTKAELTPGPVFLRPSRRS